MPLSLAILGGCEDAAAPDDRARPQYAQGANGVWTVNSLADPGDGTCDDAECTVREAIAEAAAGGQIVFASGLNGSVLLTAGALVIAKSLSIDGGGRITLDAQRNSRVLEVGDPQADLAPVILLAGLALENGLQPLTTLNGGPAPGGGAIFASVAVLTLDRVIVSHNESKTGGGGIALYANNSVTISNSTIADNIAEINGGGIVSHATLMISHSSIEGNTAQHSGGGIDNRGTLTVLASTISNNEALGGSTSTEGGGIFVVGRAAVVRSTISGNRAIYGGGIFNTASGLELRSTTISGNGAVGSGSGLVTAQGGTVTAANTIIAGNTGFSPECDVAGASTLTSLGHNLTTTTGGCSFTVATDVLVAPAQVFTQVVEQALADNGGPTKTHALIARGLAVDAGYCPGETTDQRDFARPVDDPIMPNALDACDIGAYELQGATAASADLMISQTVNKISVKQGELLTYFVRVQNHGPQAAGGVVVNDVLSSGVTFVAARANKGTFTAPPGGETGTVTWYIGEMLDGDNQVAEIEVTVLVKGRTTITNTATVAGAVSDPNEANNTAAITVSVAAGGSGGGGGGNNGGGPKK